MFLFKAGGMPSNTKTGLISYYLNNTIFLKMLNKTDFISENIELTLTSHKLASIAIV